MKRRFTLFLALVVSLLTLSLLTLQAGAAMYIVGDGPFGGWNPAGGVTMTGRPDGTYTYTATVSGKVYFVFADGRSSSSSDWDTFNSTYRYGPEGSDQKIDVETWIPTQKSSSGAYYFTGNGTQYVFKFDTINKRFRIEGEIDGLPLRSLSMARTVRRTPMSAISPSRPNLPTTALAGTISRLTGSPH